MERSLWQVKRLPYSAPLHPTAGVAVSEVQASAGLNEFEQEVSKAIASLKDTPRLDPNQPIYYPGELEAITRFQRYCWKF